MTARLGGPALSATRAWTLVLLPWALGLAALVLLPTSAPAAGLLFVVLGVAAAALIAFDAGEWPRAVCCSAAFWEGVTRNAWCVARLPRCCSSGGRSVTRAARSPRSRAGLRSPSCRPSSGSSWPALPPCRRCACVAGRVEGSRRSPRGRRAAFLRRPAAPGAHRVDRRAPAGGRSLAICAAALLLQPSAGLMFVGAALLFVAMSGSSLRRRIGVLACGLSAVVCAPAGLMLALLGIADQSIDRVASGLGFVLTCCCLSLTALLAVANPLEDRRLRRGEAPMPLNRAIWILLPGLALVLLLIVLGFAMTPMQARG